MRVPTNGWIGAAAIAAIAATTNGAAAEALRGNRYAVFEPAGDDHVVCAVGGGEEVTFYVLPRRAFERGVVADNDAGWEDVDDLRASPDGRYLAVLTYQRDASRLRVLDLPALLAERRWDVLLDLTPEPGFVKLVGWDRGRVIVRSDVDLAAVARPYPSLDEDSLFALAVSGASMTSLDGKRVSLHPQRAELGVARLGPASSR